MKKQDIPEVHSLLMKDFAANPAPVIDLMGAQGATPFRILLATILSARTKDACTAKVVKEQLFPVVSSWDDIRRLGEDELAKLIYPVGFYREKAATIKKIPDILDEKFNGEIPDDVDALTELPGVGRKTANLVVAVAFRKPAICVDVHVHRIMNRLGLVKTDSPLKTEMALRKILPVEYWMTWNACFVSFGQRECKPRNPHCATCILRAFCSNPESAKKPPAN